MAVQFKFREATAPAQRKRVIAKLEGKAGRIEPLFPGEKDPELASLYRVEGLAGKPGQQEVVSMLEDDDAVEFAEAVAGRKLID